MKDFFIVVLAWVPEAMLNVVLFAVVHYEITKLRYFSSTRYILRIILCTITLLVSNTLVRATIPYFSVAGAVMTIVHIAAFKFIFRSNFRKATALAVICMFAIMNAEVLTVSFGHRFFDMEKVGLLVISAPTRIIQLLLITAAIKLIRVKKGENTILTVSWGELNQSHKVNIIMMLILMVTALLSNANMIEILFSSYYQVNDMGSLGANMIFIFLSTLVFSAVVITVTIRMSLYAEFHIIAETVKDRPMDLFEGLIAEASEKEKGEWLQAMINGFALSDNKEIIEFCDEYAEKFTGFQYYFDNEVIEDAIPLGLHIIALRGVLDSIYCHKELIDIQIKVKFEKYGEKAKSILSFDGLGWANNKKVSELTRQKNYTDLEYILRSQNLIMSKSVANNRTVIAIY